MRVEQQLRESEERFREIFEYAPLGMSFIGVDGRFLKVNAALCRILKRSEEELLQMQWMDLIHPDELQSAVWQKERMLASANGFTEVERRYISGTGEVVWTRLRVSLLRNTDRISLYFVVQVEDVTERRRAEEALRERAARFRSIADGCPAIMWVTEASGEVQLDTPPRG